MYLKGVVDMSSHENLKDLMSNRIQKEQIDKALECGENIYAVTIFGSTINIYIETPLMQNWIRIYTIIEEKIREHFNASPVIFTKNVDILFGYYELSCGFMYDSKTRVDLAYQEKTLWSCLGLIKRSLANYFATLGDSQNKDPAVANHCVLLLDDELMAGKSNSDLNSLYHICRTAPRDRFMNEIRKKKKQIYKNIRTGIDIANERGKK